MEEMLEIHGPENSIALSLLTELARLCREQGRLEEIRAMTQECLDLLDPGSPFRDGYEQAYSMAHGGE